MIANICNYLIAQNYFFIFLPALDFSWSHNHSETCYCVQSCEMYDMKSGTRAFMDISGGKEHKDFRHKESVIINC
jgi:hypothetical protein